MNVPAKIAAYAAGVGVLFAGFIKLLQMIVELFQMIAQFALQLAGVAAIAAFAYWIFTIAGGASL